MKVTELRIGNLVNKVYSKLQKTDSTLESVKAVSPAYIDEIYYDSVRINNEDGIRNVKISDIEPIPITEEWLIKLGFSEYKRIGQRVFYRIGYFVCEVIPTGACIYYTNNEELISYQMYVHQLQNLYSALTLQELETK